MYIKTFSVSEINEYIKKVFDNDYIMRNSSIRGEISNWKVHSSGHIYFSLKDGNSKINCIMFKEQSKNLNLEYEDGMQVVATGRVSTYLKGGYYQLFCENIKLEGVGKLYLEFDRLKKKLAQEGLFDEVYKKQLPEYTTKIGVVTSPTGAAIRDIINVTERRNSGIELIIYPSLVQGMNASQNIIKGLKYFNQKKDVEVIILARGGGSIEELWAFNNEELARQIFKSNIPVVSGVGHETDFTISDFVSDMRASTPSSAAEIAVFDKEETITMLKNYEELLLLKLNNSFNNKKNDLTILKEKIIRKSPENIIHNYYNRLTNLSDLLSAKVEKVVESKKVDLEKAKLELEEKSPGKILKRGYSILLNEDGRIINNINRLKGNELLEVVMHNGRKKIRIQTDFK